MGQIVRLITPTFTNQVPLNIINMVIPEYTYLVKFHIDQLRNNQSKLFITIDQLHQQIEEEQYENELQSPPIASLSLDVPQPLPRVQRAYSDASTNSIYGIQSIDAPTARTDRNALQCTINAIIHWMQVGEVLELNVSI